MDISEWWRTLSDETRDWLAEHNGEPLSAQARAEVIAANAGDLDPSWWSGESTDGRSELTDGAVDWIEEWANREGRDT